MKTLSQYITESKETKAISIIDKIATAFDDGVNLSKTQISSLRSALNTLEKLDSFEEGWIDIAKNILKEYHTNIFKELIINCGYAKGKMFDYADRKIVLLDINGIAMPFYLSTGRGGKEAHGIPSGRWYPFFGIRTNYSRYGKLMHVTNVGWVVKGTSEDIKDFYGSQTLRDASDYLDNKYGDIRDKKGLPKGYDNTEDEEKFNQFANTINKDMIRICGGIDKWSDFTTSIYKIVNKLQ